MATKFIESGGDATGGLEFWTSTTTSGTGAIAVDSTLKQTGPSSLKFTTGASGGSCSTQKNSITGGIGRLSFYAYFTSFPTTTCIVAGIKDAGGGLYLKITSGGILQLFGLLGGQIGSNGATLNTGQWYRICLAWKITSQTVNDFRVFLDGNSTPTITSTNTDIGATLGTSDFLIGWYNDPGNSKQLNIDDIYLDDSNSLLDTGDIHATAKKPVANNTNSFDHYLGANPSNRWENVDDVPLDISTGWYHLAVTDVQENYTLQTASTGDVNITGATLVARNAWIYGNRGFPSIFFRQSFKNNNKSAGTTLAITVSNVNVDDTLLIAFTMDGATGTVSCTDNASTPNTYTVDVDKAAGTPGSGNVRTCIIRAYVSNNTNLTTVTITHPSVTARAAVVCEFSGINQTTPLDKSTSAVGASTAASSGATAATTQADEIIFGAIGAEEEAGTFTKGTGMTPDQTVADTATTTGSGSTSNVAVQAQYAIQTATGTQTADATVANTDWAACIATYKCTVGGSSLGTPKIMDNGTETAVVLDLTKKLFEVISDSSSYPSNAAGIGMRSSNATPGTYLYECGTLIAYIPAGVTYKDGTLNTDAVSTNSAVPAVLKVYGTLNTAAVSTTASAGVVKINSTLACAAVSATAADGNFAVIYKNGTLNCAAVSTDSSAGTVFAPRTLLTNAVSTDSAVGIVKINSTLATAAVSTDSAAGIVNVPDTLNTNPLSATSSAAYLVRPDTLTANVVSTDSSAGVVYAIGTLLLDGVSTDSADGYIKGEAFKDATLNCNPVSATSSAALVYPRGTLTADAVSTDSASGIVKINSTLATPSVSTDSSQAYLVRPNTLNANPISTTSSATSLYTTDTLNTAAVSTTASVGIVKINSSLNCAAVSQTAGDSHFIGETYKDGTLNMVAVSTDSADGVVFVRELNLNLNVLVVSNETDAASFIQTGKQATILTVIAELEARLYFNTLADLTIIGELTETDIKRYTDTDKSVLMVETSQETDTASFILSPQLNINGILDKYDFYTWSGVFGEGNKLLNIEALIGHYEELELAPETPSSWSDITLPSPATWGDVGTEKGTVWRTL